MTTREVLALGVLALLVIGWALALWSLIGPPQGICR